MHCTYLLINLGTIALPAAFSFAGQITFYKQWAAFFYAAFFTTLFYVAWDAAFTYLGIWGFNKQYITGLYILNLPVEEVMFFICIPFACTFTFHCFGLLAKQNGRLLNTENILTPLLIIVLAAIAIMGHQKLYTLTAFGLTATLLACAKYILKANWLMLFYITYLVIQLPFFIVNGLLTGHWLNAPVVWYNNSQNLSIRLTTIPIEDIFYGMGLLLMNIMLYQYIKRLPKFLSLQFKQ